jgi:hypothetical protein
LLDLAERSPAATEIESMKAYLSGAMEFAHQEGADWRIALSHWLKTELNHSVYDPVVESEILAKQYKATEYRSWKLRDPERYAGFIRRCVQRDLEMVQQVDYLVCLWNEGVFKGAGTAGEVTLAFHSATPVYLVNQLKPEELSGWIMACSTERFNDFDALKQFLIQKYGKAMV